MHNSKTGNVYTNCFSKLIYITFMWNVYQLVYWTHKTYGNYRAQRKSINSKPKLKYKLRRSSVFYRLDRKMFHKTIIKFTFFDFRLQIKKKTKLYSLILVCELSSLPSTNTFVPQFFFAYVHAYLLNDSFIYIYFLLSFSFCGLLYFIFDILCGRRFANRKGENIYKVITIIFKTDQ